MKIPAVGKKILIVALPVIAAILCAVFVAAVGPCTPLGVRTTVLGLCKPAQGEVGWDSAINGNFDTLDSLFQGGGFLRPSAGGFGFNAGSAGNGQLPIGNGTGFTLAPLTAGAGIVITPGPGSLTVASSGSPAGGSIFNAGTLTGSASGSDYTTTSATFVDVDATNLKATVTVPVGSKFIIVAVTFSGGPSTITNGTNLVQILAAGSAIAPGVFTNNGTLDPVQSYTLYGVLANPTSGSQTIALQFRGDGSNSYAIRNPTVEGASGAGTFMRARMLWVVTN